MAAPDTEKIDGTEACRIEYLVSAVSPNKHYSVRSPHTSVGPDGRAVHTFTTLHWFLVDVMHGHNRPHVVPTVESANAMFLCKPLSWCVVFYERWAPDGETIVDNQATYNVRPVGGPTWVTPGTLAEWDRLQWHLYSWTAKHSDHAGCTALVDQTRVKNLVPLMDPRCPTLSLAWALTKDGWEARDRFVEHTVAAKGVFDSCDAVKLKSYYQVVLTLPKCLPLCDKIPSREPVRFYKLLLRGKRAVPGLADKEYHLQLKGLPPWRGTTSMPYLRSKMSHRRHGRWRMSLWTSFPRVQRSLSGKRLVSTTDAADPHVWATQFPRTLQGLRRSHRPQLLCVRSLRSLTKAWS